MKTHSFSMDFDTYFSDDHYVLCLILSEQALDGLLSLAYISKRCILVQVLLYAKSFVVCSCTDVCILPENCNQILNAYIWCAHLGLIAIKMHITHEQSTKEFGVRRWQQVPKLVCAYLSCKIMLFIDGYMICGHGAAKYGFTM